MDVTFREYIPFYGEKTDLSDLFLDLDSSDAREVDNPLASTGEDINPPY
jgi:hypothetical protein